MKKNYVFSFKEVKFDTDEGDGYDEQLNFLLNSKFGETVYAVRSVTSEEALERAISYLIEISGFKVLDADYDLTMT